jgi:hypothetical protein
MATIQPPTYKERLLFLGSNGTGKSVLIRELLAKFPRSVSIDTKGDFEPIQPFVVVEDPDDKRLLQEDTVVYRPRPEFKSGPHLDAVLGRLFTRAQATFDVKNRKQLRPFVVNIDEGLALSKRGYTANLAEIAVSGRSLNIGLWVASQRPVWIPVEVRSEAWRIYVFYLLYEDDEKEVLKLTKRRLTLAQLQEGFENYAYWEIRRGKDSAGKLEIRHCPRVEMTPYPVPA